MGYGRILPKYKGGGKNLRKAEKLLNDFIKVERNKKEKALSYFMALHILAVYCYRQEPAFYRQSPDLEKVERLLKDSSKSFSSYHNSIAYNELGLLYVRWGNNLQKNGDSNAYNEKMNMAKEAYEKAMEIVPENQQSALHLSRVYFNYAFYSQYMGQTEQSETYIQKALEVTKKFAYIPFNHYYSLTALGDEILKDHDIDMGMRVFLGAKQLGERLQINPWYAIYKLGEIYKEKQDINQALEFYLQSAQLENTSEGYGTRRDSIKQLMKDYSIRKDRNTTLYKKCIKVRVECSKKAYELKPDDHKNCGDYGEDLKEREAFNDAIPILEKGANFIPQDSELTEDKKMEKLNWLYQEIGHCYIFLRDDTKAEEFFDKSAKAEDSAIGYFKHAGRMSDLNKHDKTVNSYKKFIDKFPSSPKDKKEKIFKDMAKTLKKIAGSYENLLKEDESVLAWKDYADVSFYSNPESDGRECGIAGNKLLKIHKFLEARECFLKSIRLEPKSAQNLSQLGYINKILQKWEECMICSERAISIRINLRDKYQYDFCQEEHNKNPKVYDTNKIDDLINLSIIEELKGQHNEALVYYKNALTLLMGQESQDENTISKYRFIADAFWILGMRDDALKLYEEKIKDLIVGHERIVVEAIIWFMSSKSLER